MDAIASLGEPRLLISRSALLHNVRVIRRALRDENVKVCAIVKADAYGHGAQIVADALCNFSSDEIEGPAVDMLAVASIDEAAALPSTSLPILIFRPVENVYLGRQRHAMELAIRQGWVQTLCSPTGADDLSRLANTIGKKALVQVMIDTGMSRGGAPTPICPDLIRKIETSPSLQLAGICTHFARADEMDNPFTRVQFLRFLRAARHFQTRKLIRHAANSAGVFFHPDTHLDMVRPGLSIYGIDPSGTPSTNRPLKPVMKWTAPLIEVRDLPEGVGVGYGQSWRSERITRIGVLPVGYADGYPRCLSDKAKVMIHGAPAPVIGRVSMDLMTIDLTDIPHAILGDEVTLLDNDPLSPASVYQLAKLADTIPYEILCRIGPRVRRVAVEPEEDLNELQQSDERG